MDEEKMFLSDSNTKEAIKRLKEVIFLKWYSEIDQEGDHQGCYCDKPLRQSQGRIC